MKFVFKVDGETRFQCKLKSHRCVETNNKGQRCRKNSVIGIPVCWIHLLSKKHLRIKNTTSIPQPKGKGLFALDRKKGENDVIFKKGETIFAYEGEYIDKATLDERYGDFTAPYAVMVKKNRYIDSACERGVASLINHANNKKNVNAKFAVTRGKDKKASGIKVVAIKDINNDKEIFLDYGKDYQFDEDNVLFKTS